MISDMLFGENTELIEQCSSYFTGSMEKSMLATSPHLDRLVVNEKEIATIDLDKFTHRYQFPPTELLLLGLIEKEQVAVLIGSDTTNIYVESRGIIDLKELGKDIKSMAGKNGSINIRGISRGEISFVPGDREEVLEAVVESIVKQL
jgi:RecJ-like exonuclease